jgi:hypothetical protein
VWPRGDGLRKATDGRSTNLAEAVEGAEAVGRVLVDAGQLAERPEEVDPVLLGEGLGLGIELEALLDEAVRSCSNPSPKTGRCPGNACCAP